MQLLQFYLTLIEFLFSVDRLSLVRNKVLERLSFSVDKLPCFSLFHIDSWESDKFFLCHLHICVKIMAVFRTNNPVLPIAFMQKSVYQKTISKE